MPHRLTVVIAVVAVATSPAAAQETPNGGGTPPPHGAAMLFETSDRCLACHNGISTSTGRDVSIGFDWRASMMANAARDPYWQAAVRREIMDHPRQRAAIEDTCSTCHMPMARYEAHVQGGTGAVFANLPAAGAATRLGRLAADGVSCSACHQITDEGLGQPESFTGGFRVDETTPWGQRSMLGPFTTDPGRELLMRSATGFTPRQAPHIQSSELCAACHTLYTESLDEEGNHVADLPEQVPYLEWRHSAFPGRGQSCQSCHMPVVEEPVPVTRVLGQPRENVNRHVFRGGNFFVLGMLSRFRAELGVQAMPQEFEATIRRTFDNLETRSATLDIALERRGGMLTADLTATNLAGHKLPTAYPSRRAWLHVRVRDAAGAIVFESGRMRDDGSIVGNDNDRDATTFEPHYTLVTDPEQVQIYEPILVDARDRVTTGLLYGVRYGKDNRILPDGFDKATAEPDIAVQGAAREDDDFAAGSDRITYRVAVGQHPGPFTVEAELWYQPIGFRWARNLDRYDAFETNRFVRYYDEMAHGSGAVLASVSSTVP